MKTSKLLQTFALLTLLFIFSQIQIITASAQSGIRVECGTTIESAFSFDTQIHTYQINVASGTSLIIYAESTGDSFQNLLVDIALTGPTGDALARWSSNSTRRSHYEDYSTAFEGRSWAGFSQTKLVTAHNLTNVGVHIIGVIGYTNTGSPYNIYISCVQRDGTVISANNVVSAVECGSIIDNEFVWDTEIHIYYLRLRAGDSISLIAESAADDFQNLLVDIALTGPTGNTLARWSSNSTRRSHYEDYSTAFEGRSWAGFSQTDAITANQLSDAGVYRIGVIGYTNTGSRYTFQVGCTLADGTVIHMGDGPLIDLTSPAEELLAEPPQQPVFSGFGFPGLASVDFTDIARLPIPAGIPMSGAVTPTGSEILGYQFDAEAGDTIELSFNRLSGNLNLGLVVIDSESNVIYQASLVTTQSMTARFTVPTAGQYTAGIFRISLLPPSAPEPTAFQVVATVNP